MNLKQTRQRRGLATIITSAIMMSAVVMMGSAGVVWSQTSLAVQQADMANTASNYMNKLNESLVFEYVYCASDPCDQINVVLTNVGHVGLDVSELTISEKMSGFSKIQSVTNGQITPQNSIEITVNDAGFSSYGVLDVMVKTNRGNIIQTQTNT
jgi:archaellum component FlaF (FlaF/FlaG flagellin family)